jgi:CIC family chloride channel protein
MDGEESRQLPLTQLSLLALGLGVITGLGAVLFRDLIGLIHNLLFTGHAVVHYDANIFTAPAPWGPLVVMVPVLGAVGVTFLVTNFAPEAKGHGVPEVMDAIYYKGGVIRPVVALVKSLASAIADRLCARLYAWADYPHAGGPADRTRRCGRRRGHRIHL